RRTHLQHGRAGPDEARSGGRLRQAPMTSGVGPHHRPTPPPPGRLTAARPEPDDLGMTTLQQAEAADHAQIEELDRLVIVKSVIYTSGERDPRAPLPRPPDQGKRYLMGHDPRLP